MTDRTVNCAGPHVAPVPLYTVSYDPSITSPRDPAVLCSDCNAVYAAGVNAPPLIDSGATNPDGTTVMIPNPDYSPPGHVPSALIVKRRNQEKNPNWTPPPHNYKTPPGQSGGTP